MSELGRVLAFLLYKAGIMGGFEQFKKWEKRLQNNPLSLGLLRRNLLSRIRFGHISKETLEQAFDEAELFLQELKEEALLV